MRRLRRPSAVAGGALLVAGALAACGGAARPRQAPASPLPPRPPAGFAWLHPAPPPSGWTTRRLPDGALLAYPAGWRAQRSDTGAATGVLLDRRGRIAGYLNVTPQQGAEQPAGWAKFRIEHNRDEGDFAVRRIAAAEHLRFRTGAGSCVIDQYRTTQHAYREIACIVEGRADTAVIVGAAPPSEWSRRAPQLERAISAFAD